MDSLLQLEMVGCDHDRERVVEGIDLKLTKASLSCLLGPSGCGKTTVLRAIAGFHPVSTGRIFFAGRVISEPGWQLPPEQRGIGMVFQDYALFPHLSVAENIVFGIHQWSKKEKRRRVSKLLELVELEAMASRYPHELSGGQQQRVALARALAPEPQLLLLDEPFSNLDVEMRERLANDVVSILNEEGTAALFVTHDQQEAFLLGTHVGVMQQGVLQQWDTPFNLYHEPANRFVADFIGEGCFIRGHLSAPEEIETPLGVVIGNRAYRWPQGSAVQLLLRPDDVTLNREGELRGHITGKAFRGAETLYRVAVSGVDELLSLMPSSNDFLLGEEVAIYLEVEHLVLFQA